MEITYLDDSIMLGQGFLSRNYSFLREKILLEKESLTNYIDLEGEVYGYRVSKNIPVSHLYMQEVFNVKFVLSRVDTLHSNKQEKFMKILCHQLYQYIIDHPAYYIIRLPIHIVDLLRAFHEIQSDMYFCGGTIEQISVSDPPAMVSTTETEVCIAIPDYIEKHRDKLLKIITESFGEYSSQYHVNPATEEKAGEVYSNWITSALKFPQQNSIVVVTHKSEPIGVALFHENEIGIESLLVAVDREKRGHHSQQSIYALLSHMAKEKKKVFVSSTQLDNFISAGNMNAIGMRPFYGIYNYHIDSQSNLKSQVRS